MSSMPCACPASRARRFALSRLQLSIGDRVTACSSGRKSQSKALFDTHQKAPVTPALLASFLAMMATGVPVAIAMAGSALVYILLTGDIPPFVVVHRMISGIEIGRAHV